MKFSFSCSLQFPTRRFPKPRAKSNLLLRCLCERNCAFMQRVNDVVCGSRKEQLSKYLLSYLNYLNIYIYCISYLSRKVERACTFYVAAFDRATQIRHHTCVFTEIPSHPVENSRESFATFFRCVACYEHRTMQ